MRVELHSTRSTAARRRHPLTRRVAQAVRVAWDVLAGAPAGRVFSYDPNLDSDRSELAKTLTFAKLHTIISSAKGGDITDALELFEDMESRDLRLFSLANTRRLGVTRLQWEIVSAADVQARKIDEAAANEAASYVREHLDDLPTFKTALDHLATAIGPNLAVVEKVWEYGELIELEPVPNGRLTMKPQESDAIRVRTAEERSYGIEADPRKFVVYTPKNLSGSPLAKTLSQATAYIWLYKKLAVSDWGAFCELFGMPVRVGKYDRNTPDREKTALKNMLENMGSRAWAMISRAVEIEFVESSQRGTAPFEAFMNALGREMAMGWLGATMSADTTGATGTYAAARVHDEVRDDLQDDDLAREAAMVREQIIAPMVAYRFPGRDMPIPFFQRSKPEDSKALAETVSAWQQAGLPVPLDWARRKSGIPEVKAGEAVLTRPDAWEEGIREMGD